MNKLLTIIFLINSLRIIPANSGDDLSRLEWILGEWVADNGANVTTESWEKVSPKTFEGEGITRSVSGDEIRNYESLRLVEMSGETFYIAKVTHNEFPTSFKLVEQNDSTAVFENLTHDFPTRIEYRLLSADSISVRVSGGDKFFTIEFERKNRD
ncbi:hypothetical protein GF337_18280 [candidate division KSB1 bacterium]|nr:hypothetical protein [candidate division KSB1 bacterium]